jgi:hypothetical protein
MVLLMKLLLHVVGWWYDLCRLAVFALDILRSRERIGGVTLRFCLEPLICHHCVCYCLALASSQQIRSKSWQAAINMKLYIPDQI